MESFDKLICIVGEDIPDHDGSSVDGFWRVAVSLLEREKLTDLLVEELRGGNCGVADNTVVAERTQMLINESKNRMTQSFDIVENNDDTVLEHN